MMTPTTKLIILDRDGVINHDSDAFIKSPDEWQVIPGSAQAIARLNQAGYTVVVATNQSGVARKLFPMTTLNAIHQKMHATVEQVGGMIAAVFFCPHCVGDSLRDLQSGFVLGCIPNLVLTGKGQGTMNKGGLPPGTQIHSDLAAMVDALLSTQIVTTD